MSALDVLILALATWRLTSWLVDPLDGDFALFAKLRYFVGIRYDEHSNAYCEKREWLGRWFLCSWCMSVAVGTAFAGLYVLLDKQVILLALPLALSTGSILVDSIILRMTRRRNY